MRRIAALLLGLLAAGSTLTAQAGKPERVPARPPLGAGADTNDVFAYHQLGVSLLDKVPARAADAFYWAARLDPSWAEPLYARRLALLMSNPERFLRYLDGSAAVLRAPETRRIDSLYHRALLLNPFLPQRLDHRALVYVLVETSAREYRLQTGGGEADRSGLDYWIRTYLRSAGPAARARIAASEGRLSDALGHYAQALKRTKEPAGLYADRARLFFLLNQPDSAQAQMALAVSTLREDEKELVRFYDSKALFEHSLGMIHEQAGRREEARAAYARALQEDLAYYPAHLRLGALAAAQGDTATALAEVQLAAQVRADDAAVRTACGQVLLDARRAAEAEPHLREAIRLEPFFAEPYVLLGRALEAQGRKADAEQVYREYVARASRQAPKLAWAKQRLSALTGAAAASAEERRP